MPHADFFVQLGLFAARQFVTPETCARYCAEARSVVSDDARIRKEGDTEEIVDTRARKTSIARVSKDTLKLVKSQLMSLKPQLENHFQLALEDCEQPQFLVYREGFFYHQHYDSSNEPDAPSTFQNRKVSAVIFLNNQVEQPDDSTYSGGALTFYGLLNDPGWENAGLPLVGETGLLIAFRSNVLHEVKPVTGGERFTIVTWFF